MTAAMLSLVAWMLDGMTISGFWSAFFGAIVVSITGWAASSFIGDQGNVGAIRTPGRRRAGHPGPGL